ncbi:recombinase family protein [Massilia putida]|uniref:recombinase family protein n=1 Tax=Massilia putida TaxID=1141883 RepID=UPI000952F482|nr:recombinase family protein [Massilia putida]
MRQPNARIYQRVSTKAQDLTRQDALRAEAEAKGYKVVATYSEKESGTTEKRPELQRMLADLNEGDIIIAEHLDRITRLPMDKAEALMGQIKAKGATVSVPGLIDLPTAADGMTGIVMESMQAMLLKMALYQCRADWETRRERQRQGIEVAKAKGAYRGRKPDTVANAKIVELRAIGYTIAKVASTLNVSESQVKLILKKAKEEKAA